MTDQELYFTRIAQINVELDRLMSERAIIIKTTRDDFFKSDDAKFNEAYRDWEIENKLARGY